MERNIIRFKKRGGGSDVPRENGLIFVFILIIGRQLGRSLDEVMNCLYIYTLGRLSFEDHHIRLSSSYLVIINIEPTFFSI